MSTGKSDTVLLADFGDCWLSYSFLLFALPVVNDCSRSLLLLSSVVNSMLVSSLCLQTW